jgi:predicted esterase/photosystem II stability/assembly factor-like uncharacterized protein
MSAPNRVAWLALLVPACSSPSNESSDAAVDATIDVGCGAPTGDFHSQVLAMGDGIEDRYYWMHVPSTYSCTTPMPILVDFHGTAGDVPEEAYQTPALIEFSDATGVIVVRPRSRSSVEGGVNLYRWDENGGDIARNMTYARNLVADLEHRYAIDPERVYASGFSSGSNMAAQFLTDAQSPFKGLAPIAGGEWSTPALRDQTTGPYVFMSTGYRDYLWPTAKDLIAALAIAHQPADHLCVRHTGGGHDLYPWHFAELWQFLDGHTCPVGSGTATTPWTVSTLPAGTDVNAFALSGTTLVAAGAQGKTWTYTADGWASDLARDDADYTALCFGPSLAFVGGDYKVAFGTTTTWNTGAGFPDYGMLGVGWANAASCRDDGSVVVVGYWSAALTANSGTTWSQFHEPTMYPGVEGQLAGVGTSPGGATVAVGYYDYVGRTPIGQTTSVVIAHPNPAGAEWWNGVAALSGGTFWVVGDNGSIIMSIDDGQTWTAQISHTTENLYAVHFFDANHGAAVGRRGTVVVTSDGGSSWTPRPLGKDVYLGAVHVDATTVWIAGEGGLVATSPR